MGACSLFEKRGKMIMTPKFELLVDLGVITMPEDHDPVRYLSAFREKHQEWCGFNGKITDVNFSNPSRIIGPGDKLWVRAYRQVSRITWSRERLAFLCALRAYYTGAQGVAAVLEQKRHLLPKNFCYASLDIKDHLPAEGRIEIHFVPEIRVTRHGHFSFNLGVLEAKQKTGCAILAFSDPKLREQTST